MDLVQLLSSIAVTLTVCMFLAGIPSCVEIFRHKSVGNIPFLPFITTEVNSMLWFSYGVATTNWSLIICNTIGCVLQASYIITFITFSKPKTKPLQQTLTGLIFLIATYVYMTRFLQTDKAMITQLGLLGASLTMVMYLSPLAELVDIVRTRDASSISVPLTIAQFFSSTSWFLFGLLINDIYIYFPNMPGIISCLVRIFLMNKYGNNHRSTKNI